MGCCANSSSAGWWTNCLFVSIVTLFPEQALPSRPPGRTCWKYITMDVFSLESVCILNHKQCKLIILHWMILETTIFLLSKFITSSYASRRNWTIFLIKTAYLSFLETLTQTANDICIIHEHWEKSYWTRYSLWMFWLI
jgi:hypothetical protein